MILKNTLSLILLVIIFQSCKGDNKISSPTPKPPEKNTSQKKEEHKNKENIPNVDPQNNEESSTKDDEENITNQLLETDQQQGGQKNTDLSALGAFGEDKKVELNLIYKTSGQEVIHRFKGVPFRSVVSKKIARSVMDTYWGITTLKQYQNANQYELEFEKGEDYELKISELFDRYGEKLFLLEFDAAYVENGQLTNIKIENSDFFLNKMKYSKFFESENLGSFVITPKFKGYLKEFNLEKRQEFFCFNDECGLSSAKIPRDPDQFKSLKGRYWFQNESDWILASYEELNELVELKKFDFHKNAKEIKLNRIRSGSKIKLWVFGEKPKANIVEVVKSVRTEFIYNVCRNGLPVSRAPSSCRKVENGTVDYLTQNVTFEEKEKIEWSEKSALPFVAKLNGKDMNSCFLKKVFNSSVLFLECLAQESGDLEIKIYDDILRKKYSVGFIKFINNIVPDQRPREISRVLDEVEAVGSINSPNSEYHVYSQIEVEAI